MTREYCLFHKYGFCKNGDKCAEVHLKEVCNERDCQTKNCNKRHPRPCKFMSQYGFCKFNSKCSYSHKLPKMIEDQNAKIEALERKIEDQNEVIKDLKIKMLENQRKEIDKLHKEINLLKSKNNEKELLIQKIDSAVKNMEEKHATNITTVVDDKKKSLRSAKKTKPQEIVEDVTLVNDDDSSSSDEFIETSLKLLSEVQEVVENTKNNVFIREQYKIFIEKLGEEALAKNVVDSELKLMMNKLKGKNDEHLGEYTHTDTLKMNLAILRRDLLNHKLQFHELQFQFKL